MNKKVKYCSIFLILTFTLLLATSLVSASEVTSDDTEISDNIVTNTASDDSNVITQTVDNNNKESQTIEKEVDKTSNANTTTTSKQLNKNEKNLKGYDMSCTLTLSPNSAEKGSEISATLSKTALRKGTSYSYTLYMDNVIIETGTLTVATTGGGGPLTFTVPNTATAGAHTIKLSAAYTKNTNYVGSATLTIIESSVDTLITPVEDVTGKIGSTVIPVTVTDINGDTLQSDATLTFKDGETVLLDNVTISGGVASVSVPTNRVGTYPITILFNGNNKYNPSSIDVNVTVLKADTLLEVEENDEGFYNAINVIYNTVANGKLVTTDNVAVPEAEIIINIDGTDYTVTTDSEGKFTYKYEVTEITDDIPITINYNGNDLYNAASEVSGTFDIEPVTLSISLDEISLSEVNETTTISGSVIDEMDNPVVNTPVNITLSDVNEAITVTTDSEGLFSYDFVFGQPGDVTVTATKSSENGIYDIEDATTEFTVVVGPKRTNLTVDVGEGSDKTIKINNIQPYHDVLITSGNLVDIFNENVVNADITVLINNEAIPVVTDSEGNFEVIYNATEGLTSYNITIKFDGNDAYKPAGEVYTGTFTTSPIQMSVTLDDNLNEEYLISEDVIISGHATLEDGTYNNQPVTLTIDNKNYTTTTDENGDFTYTYTTTRDGQIPVIGTINNRQANVSTSSLNINVVKPEASIIIDEIPTSRVLREIQVNGKFIITSNETPIQDTISLNINGQNINLETSEEGLFTYTYTPTSTGVNTVIASYNGNKYIATDDNTTFDVVKLKTIVIGDDSQLSVKVLDDIKISGQLVDEDSNPISDAEIAVIVNDETFTTTTDSNGIYTYNYQTTDAVDNNIYEVRYFGNDTYDMSRNYVGNTFDVEKLNAHITVNAENTVVNKATTITGTVYDEKDNKLTSIEVSLLIEGSDFITSTDEQGAYTYDYIPQKSGNLTIIARINDDSFISTPTNTTINVGKPSTNVVIDQIIAIADKSTKITATVTDENNQPVNSGKIVFKVNGVSIKDENGKIVYGKVENGTTSINYTFTESQLAKTTNVVGTYSGSTNYNAAKSNVVIVEKYETTGVATITLNDITANPGQTVILTAIVKDGENNVINGKVVFKINGKTVKDENGKVIYAQVNNGLASCEYTIPEAMKIKNYTLSSVLTSPIYNRTDAEAQLIVTDEIIIPDTNDTVIIINNDTIRTYFTNNGISALVKAGDTLDFQGTINRGNGLTKILVNKPVNIITSTHDGRIENFDEITFNNGASGSNVTGLYTYDTQFYIKNAHHITLDNITNNVSTKVVGTNVGQTSIRENSTYITVINSLFYTKNTQSSTLVFAWADNCYVNNCTVIGEGAVGNLVYFTRYNVNVPGGVVPNTNNTVTNCRIFGPSTSQIICYAFGISGKNLWIENNTINYVGYGITRQSDAGSSSNLADFQNITFINNVLNDGCGIGGVPNMVIINNTVNDGGYLTPTDNNVLINNTITGTFTPYGNNVTYINNTFGSVDMYTNYALYNSTILGNINLEYKTSSRTTTDNTLIENNTIHGSIISKGYSNSKLNSNNKIIGNTILGSISLTQTQSTLIENNNISGTISVVNTSPHTIINNNTVITNNSYAITAQNTYTNITNNYLVAGDKIGNAAISAVANVVMINNGPQKTVTISADDYNNYFNSEGVFTASVANDTTLALQGEFENVVMKFTNGRYSITSNDENTLLKDSTIISTGSSKLDISNIRFALNDNTNAVTLESSDNKVNNVSIDIVANSDAKVEAIKVLNNNNNITNNIINITTSNQESTAIVVDNSKNIIISDNTIYIEDAYAINVVQSDNVTIKNNYLNSSNGKGDYAIVTDEESNITTQSNIPGRNIVEIVADDIVATIYDTISINVQLVDITEATTINEGVAVILINGEVLTDLEGNKIIFDVNDGKISLTDYTVPTGWLRSDVLLSVKYLGTEIYDESISDINMIISKLDADVEILSQDITASVGQTVTLQAKITSNGELLSTGRVTFKFNGETLKDDDGNPITVDVIDGIATLEYVISDKYSADSYELTAIFIDSLYNRAESTSTIIIE